jgi:hypothetical protein
MSRWAILIGLVLLVLIVSLLTGKALGFRSVEVDAAPLPQPAQGFDFGWWDEALGRWVQDGRVDYARVLHEADGLKRFVATLAAFGPNATPERFETEPERLAYYINAYNALALLAVVDNWPIDSVQDVHGWLDPRPGFGFFYALRLPLDGARTNLYELEHGVIRRFADARIHAAINCASNSCPALGARAYTPSALEAQLDRATREFCSKTPHVRIDHEAKQIALSAIFDWYRADFEEHARSLGRPATLQGFIQAFAEPELASELRRAEAEAYEQVFLPYDWALNRL